MVRPTILAPGGRIVSTNFCGESLEAIQNLRENQRLNHSEATRLLVISGSKSMSTKKISDLEEKVMEHEARIQQLEADLDSAHRELSTIQRNRGGVNLREMTAEELRRLAGKED